jgi:hypothetical protein
MPRTWVYDPHSGGVKIPMAVRERTKNRILAHASKHYAGKYTHLDVHFRGQLCYIDAYIEPSAPPGFDPTVFGESREEYLQRLRETPIHLCRLRYFGDEQRWSMTFYTYSNEKYEPCVFDNGTFHGTPEEAFDTAAVYLQD